MPTLRELGETPDPGDIFEADRYGGFAPRPLPNLQPLFEGGGDLQYIGPQFLPNAGRWQFAPPSGVTLPNIGLSYTRPFRGGDLELQLMRPELRAPVTSQPEFGFMLNYRRPF
jgi:hypothetical protein